MALSRGVSTIEPVNRVIVPILLAIVLFTLYWSMYLPYAGMGLIHMFTPSWSEENCYDVIINNLGKLNTLWLSILLYRFSAYRRTFWQKMVRFHFLCQNPIFDKTDYSLADFSINGSKIQIAHTLQVCTSICHSLFSFSEKSRWVQATPTLLKYHIIYVIHVFFFFKNLLVILKSGVML